MLALALLYFSATLNIFVGFFAVFSRRRRNKEVRYFTILAFVTAAWILTNPLMVSHPPIFTREFWVRLVYAVGVLVAPTAIIWLYVLLKKKIPKHIFFIITSTALYFSLLCFIDGLVIKQVDTVDVGSWTGTVGPLFFLYSSYSTIIVILIFYLLFRSYPKANSERKTQIRYILLGALLFGITASIVSFVLPSFGINDYIKLDSPSSIFFIGAIAYAILRHKLLDLRVVATQILVLTLDVFLFARFLLSDGLNSYILNGLVFVLASILGILLVKSVLKEIARRKETEQINNSLRALRDITRKITESLDFSEVTQELVDEVTNRLGYKGALVISVEKDKKTVRAVTLSQTKEFTNALKLLPKKYSDFTGNVLDDSLTAKIISTGIVQKSNDLSDFISPAVDPVMAIALQKRIGLQSLVGVPITSEGTVRGVLLFGLAKPVKEILDREIDTMKSLGDQLGIVTRNIEIIQELKRLDQAKSDFLSIASHQLRTPISATKGYISMILDGDFGEVPPTTKEALDKVYSANNRLINLINDLLNVSRIEKGRMLYNLMPVDILEVINEVIEVIEPQAKQKGLKLNVSLPKKLPMVLADKEKLRQLIMNITDNSIKYTNEGHIDIAIEKDAKSGSLKYSVKDSGVGISDKDLPHLFQRFSRGTNISVLNTEGTGLGLYVAKQIAKAHNANVWAESEGKGKGAQFYLDIPFIKKES